MTHEDHPFELELKKSGAIIQVPAARTATEALKANGITVDVKCSDGLCGVCATPLLEGQVEHRDFVLSEAQRQQKIILCCSRAKQPAGRLVVDL